MIRTHFIAGITALAIGVAGLTAAPAQASDDTAKILTGVAALAILGTVIAKSGKNDRHDYALSRGHSPRYYGHSKHRHHRHKAHRGHHGYKSKHHRRHGGHRYKKYDYK